MSSVSKRMRVFAGPNGSGKSTILKVVQDQGIDIGTYINADDYKKSINENHNFDFSDSGSSLNKESFIASFKKSPLFDKADGECLLSSLSHQDNHLLFSKSYLVNDYFTSFLASYIREQLLANSNKFTFETVMSHPSKLEFMSLAKEKGFKVYLYFVSLANPELNKQRVDFRVKNGGHSVPPKDIENRYYRTMGFLYDAIRIADSSYIFDNSYSEPKLFATVVNKEIKITDGKTTIPLWFQKYVLDKLK